MANGINISLLIGISRLFPNNGKRFRKLSTLKACFFGKPFFLGENMYKYEIWCEGGWCHDSEVEFDDYDDCVEEAELDVSTYDEGTHWYEIKEV